MALLRQKIVSAYESGHGTLDEVAALALRGSVDREAFDAFVTELLAARLRCSDVVLLDNLRVHHAGDAEKAALSASPRPVPPRP